MATGGMRRGQSSRGRRIAGAALVVISLLVGLFALLRPGAESRPDIVLVVWDTCRADHLSAWGYGRPTTPVLERLAREGVLFERCMTAAPLTAPSHGSMFTGLLPSRHRLRVGRGDRLRDDVPVLAETLRDGGYETVCLSANPFLGPLTGLSRGFDFHRIYSEGPAGRKDAALALEAVDSWLASREESRKPLFLVVNMMDTHLPLDPPPACIGRVRRPGVTDEAIASAALLGPANAMAHMLGIEVYPHDLLEGLRTRYDAAALHMDEYTGRVLDRLRESGVLGDGLVIVAGDHGENLGEHGEMDHRTSVYQPLVHVPLLLHRPGHFDGGRREPRQVSLVDLHSTILETAGMVVPAGTGLDSRSLAGAGPGRAVVCEGPDESVYLDDLRLSFPGVDEGVFARVRLRHTALLEPPGRAGARKYIRVTAAGPEGTRVVREELYDLAADPGEMRNLLAPGPGRTDAEVKTAARLSEALDAMLAGTSR